MGPMRQLGVHHRHHRNVAIPLVTNYTANVSVGFVSHRLPTLLGGSQPRKKWRMCGAPPGGRAQPCPSVPAGLAGVLAPQEHRPLSSRVNSLQTTLLPWGGQSRYPLWSLPLQLMLGCVVILAAREGRSTRSPAPEVLSVKGCKNHSITTELRPILCCGSMHAHILPWSAGMDAALGRASIRPVEVRPFARQNTSLEVCGDFHRHRGQGAHSSVPLICAQLAS